MKNNWQTKKIGDVAKICLGLTHTPKYVDKGVPFLSVKDITQGHISFNNTRFITREEFNSMPDGAKPKQGDVLFCRVGTIGYPQIINEDKEFGIFVSLGFFRTKNEILFNRYIAYWMRSPLFYDQVRENVQGSTLKNLNTGWLKNFDILLPPLPEQKRIVKTLDEIFEKTTKAKENAEKNLQNARELFESYLQSIFTNPGDNWQEKKLGDVCEYFNGKAHEQCIDEEGQYIVVNSKFISSDGRVFKRTNDALFLLSQGDIAMVLSDVPNGKALAKCYLVEKDDTYSLNQRICAIRSDKFHIRFLYYQLNRNKYFLSFDNGENQTNLRLNQILSCPLYIPSISEQEDIANKLDTFSEEAKKLEDIYQRKLTDLEELKQSILQKAFDGELTGARG